MPPRGAILAAVLPLCLMLSACTGAPEQPPASVAERTGSTDAPAYSPPVPPPTVRADGCSGPLPGATVCLSTANALDLPAGLITDTFDVGVADEPPRMAGYADMTTLQPDGRVAGARRPFSKDVDAGYVPPLEIGWYVDGILQPFSTQSDEPHRAAAVLATDGETVVWKETTATDLYVEDWWIKAYANGRVTTVATSDDLGFGHTLPWAGSLIALASGVVYWTAGVPDASLPAGGKGVLLAKRIDGTGAIQTVADDAYLPTSDGWGNLYYGLADGHEDVRLFRVPPGGLPTQVATVPLHGDYTMTGLAADGDHLAWSLDQRTGMGGLSADNYHAWIYIQDLGDGSLTEVALNSSGGGGNVLSLSGGWIGWGDGSGWGDTKEYLLHLADGHLYTIGDAPGGSWVHVSFPAVAWREPHPSDDPSIGLVNRDVVGFLPSTSGSVAGPGAE
ncbi:MAG: hypothetical protein FWC46_07735 [Actinomycetia bacterium]|nr:hypothetical protein [Actinomycetes bacterium]